MVSFPLLLAGEEREELPYERLDKLTEQRSGSDDSCRSSGIGGECMSPFGGLKSKLQERSESITTSLNPCYQAEMEDRVAIYRKLQALARMGVEALVTSPSVARLQLLPAPSDGDFKLSWKLLEYTPEAPFIFHMKGYNTVFSGEIPHIEKSVEYFSTPLPTKLVCTRLRKYRRVQISREDSLRFRAEGVSPTPLWDISYEGLSFRMPFYSPSLPCGGGPRAMEVGDASNAVHLDGEVHAIRENETLGFTYHLRVYPRTPLDKQLWVAWVDQRLHPRTRVGSVWAEKLWTLYGDCGYFNISAKQPREFEDTYRDFVHVAEGFEKDPDLGCHVVWPSTSWGVAGAASAIHLYTGTWYAFHLAKMAGDTPEGVAGRSVLRDIHVHLYEHVQWQEKTRWVMTYILLKKNWSRCFYYDAIYPFVASGHASITRLRLLEMNCELTRLEPPERTNAHTEVTCEVFPCDTAAQRKRVAEWIARIRPHPYVEALDLVEERLDLERNKKQWQQAGLERDRLILIVRQGSLYQAAAVMEYASKGTHLLGLFNTVRLFPLQEGGDTFFPILLAQARAWFQQKDRKWCVIALEEGMHLPPSEFNRMLDIGVADLVILSAFHIPEMLEYLYELTAPKLSTQGPVSSRPIQDM